MQQIATGSMRFQLVPEYVDRNQGSSQNPTIVYTSALKKIDPTKHVKVTLQSEMRSLFTNEKLN